MRRKNGAPERSSLQGSNLHFPSDCLNVACGLWNRGRVQLVQALRRRVPLLRQQLLLLLLAEVDGGVREDRGRSERGTEKRLRRVGLVEDTPAAQYHHARLELAQHLVGECRADSDDEEAAPVDLG